MNKIKIKERMDALLKQAIVQHASDLFFLPKEDKIELCFRTLAGLNSYRQLEVKVGREVINYLKYAAQMDVAEHRRPQVGAMLYVNDHHRYYLRLSSLGDFNDQESLVIRIIYKINVKGAYFFPEKFALLQSLTTKRGLIITSGPTGSGKTTTMYELARQISRHKMVMTIEDPVEIHESRFLQTQVNDEAGVDYFKLLKAALRHRPDVLVIGEIRDSGTAKLAINAALSGHLVLATVHAKSTMQTISRLEGLGITENELDNCLTAVSYQRLLPTKDGVACLLDVADESFLRRRLTSQFHADFVTWQDQLERLRNEGKISDTTYLAYQEG